MLIAGGACFVIFSVVSEKCKRRTHFCKASLCALGVTLVELVFGIVFNLIFKMNVWDYSEMPFNLFGQICLLYTLLWGALAAACLPLAELINRKLEECK